MNISWWEIAAVIAFALAGFKIYRHGTVSTFLSAYNFSRPKLDLIEGEIPDELYYKAFIDCDNRFNAIGFDFFCNFRYFSGIIEDSRPHFSKIYFNPQHKTYAMVTIDNESPPDSAFSTQFISFIDESTSMTTFNLVLLLSLPTDERRQPVDSCCETLEQHWKFHQNRLEEAKHQNFMVYLEKQDLCFRLESDMNKEMKQLVEMPDQPDATASIGLKKSISFTGFLFQGLNLVSQQLKNFSFPEKIPPGLTEADTIRVLRNQDIHGRINVRLPHRIALTASSMIVSAVALGTLLSWRFVPILIVTLLIHELGHLFAMKIFGFSNCRLLFLPPFGAAAHGEKKDPPAWQTLTMLFMGPIPGILISLALIPLWAFYRHDWLIDSIAMMFIINYFNLLPVTPLDGGRIVEILFLNRFPNIRLVFAGLSVILLLVGGILTSDVFMLSIAVLFGYIFVGRLKNKDNRNIDHHFTIDDEIARTTRLCDDLLASPLRKNLALTRTQIIMQRLKAPKPASPGWSAFIAGSLVYFSLLAMPASVLLIREFIPPKSGQNYNSPIDWEEEISNTTEPEKRRNLLMEAASVAYDQQNPEKVKYCVQEAEKASWKLPDPSLQVIETWCRFIDFAYLDEDRQTRDDYFHQGMKLASALPPKGRCIAESRLLGAWVPYHFPASESHVLAVENCLNQALLHLEKGHNSRIDLMRLLLGLYQQTGNSDKTGNLTDLGLEEISAAASISYYTFHQTAVDAMLHFNQEREAENLLENFIHIFEKEEQEKTPAPAQNHKIANTFNLPDVYAILGWIKLKNREFANAEVYFKKALKFAESNQELSQKKIPLSGTLAENQKILGTAYFYLNLSAHEFLTGKKIYSQEFFGKFEKACKELNVEASEHLVAITTWRIHKNADLGKFQTKTISNLARQFLKNLPPNFEDKILQLK